MDLNFWQNENNQIVIQTKSRVNLKANFSTHKKINQDKEIEKFELKKKANEFIRNFIFYKFENKNNSDIEKTKSIIKLNLDGKTKAFVYTEPNDLFDFVIKNEELKKCFIKEIKDILKYFFNFDFEELKV